ncbi:MAG: DUF2892 domain-containing protein [Deltaproteobacteria bacterium]|nr:DUF2892 domain-containing protein [Deltaproteobacteria bacterium]
MILLKKNMGRVDQILRLTVGLLFIYLGFVNQSIIGDRLYAVMIGIFGAVNIGSAFFRFCPFYLLAGLSTVPKE